MSANPKDGDRPQTTQASIERTTTKTKASLAVGTAVSTALTAYLASKGVVPVGWGAVPTVMFSLVSLLVDERGRRELRRWAFGIERAAGDKPPEVIAEELCSKADEEWAQDGVLESFRRAIEALDTRAVPYVGCLLWHYTHGDLKTNKRFFRNFGRVLSELDGDELDALRILIGREAENPEEYKALMVRSSEEENRESANRAVRILKQHHLASEVGVWGDEDYTRDKRIIASIRRKDVRAMLLVIGDELVYEEPCPAENAG